MIFATLSPEEVRWKYDRAENKAQMIEILCGLTAASRSELLRFLGLEKTPTSKFDPRSGAGRALAVFDEALARKLLEEGVSAKIVAERVRISRSAMYVWMEKNGIKTNYRTGLKEKDDRRMALYQSGATDREIAEAEGICLSSAAYWRSKRDLPPNEKK